MLPAGRYGGYAGRADQVDCHEHHEEHSGVFLSALRHTVEILLFILLFNFLLGLLFEWVGEDAITTFLLQMGPLQPMAAALVGLISLVGGIFLFVCWLMGLIYAIQEQEKEVPLLGKIRLLK